MGKEGTRGHNDLTMSLHPLPPGDKATRTGPGGVMSLSGYLALD